MTNFITNSPEKKFKTRLIELIKYSEEMKFLIGFFYFSGIDELYEGLANNSEVQLKILVGMNVDKFNHQLIEYSYDDPEASDNEKSEKYFAEIRESLSSENFDTREFYERISFFIQMIKEDRILIRKTREPNHAKIYLFHDEDNPYKKKMFITGSSNLTKPALTTQAEFNVEISDYGTEETEAYFDDLWVDSIEITEYEETKQRLIEVVEKGTQVREITPFEAYVLVLKTYLESFEENEIRDSLIKTLEDNDFIPYQYQLDAVKQALSIIEKNNGVIVADVVGLGKTVIACCVAKELGKRGIVLCPPALIGDRNKDEGWLSYLEKFKLTDWEVRSIGDLEKTSEFVRKVNDIEVVVIDEVHRFRNQDTKSYELLKNICRDKIVIMLTATPFNNRPADILSLIKLFITPKKSTITLQNNLVSMFRTFKTVFDYLSYIKKYYNSSDSEKREKAKNYYRILFNEVDIDLDKVMQRSKDLANQIRHVIEPITIRRNRLDLKQNPKYKDEVDKLSEVADPIEWFFELTPEQSELYDRIIKIYFGSPEEGGQFKGAIYRPFIYETEIEGGLGEKENFELIQQRNLFDFMRRLMVKRFESSFGSFEQSIRRFKRITKHALEFIEKTNKFILDRDLLEQIYALEEDEIEIHLEEYAEELQQEDHPRNIRVYEVDKFVHRDEFIQDIHHDLKLFDKIIQELDSMDLVEDDPKAQCLLDNIDGVLESDPVSGEPKRKVVIFSEYMDTVKHLSKSLKKKYKKRLFVVDGSLSKSKIKVINRNFDASHPDPEDKYDILLSTDRISEGFNLNRAGMVINYDIPWNPVRVIQRVGRINRISKKVFEELYIVNFFPTEMGAELVKSKMIASQKMFLIHQVLGEDAKIFDIDETPTAAGLYQRVTQNPEEWEEESFYTKVLNRFEKIKNSHPGLIDELDEFPPRVKVAKAAEKDELLVFFKKGRMYIQGLPYSEEKMEPYRPSLEEILPKIECEESEERLALSDEFWGFYETTREVKEKTQGPPSELSNEKKAINNLKALIHKDNQKLRHHRDFIQMLLEDIVDYGTLPDFTLRRLANLNTHDNSNLEDVDEEFSKLKTELGESYLKNIKKDQRQLYKEIIIAIENRKI